MQQLLYFLSDNPAVRITQLSLLALAVVAVFLICFTTRDILLRTRSFLYQAVSILLVALLPIVGFFLYLLIRPARTVKERETEQMLRQILQFTEETQLLAEEPPKEEESSAAVAASSAPPPAAPPVLD